MPIEPIDLQVLFSRMIDVGKEVALRNELVTAAQSLEAGELVKETEEQSRSVNQTKESDEVRGANEHGASGRGSKGQEGPDSKGKSSGRSAPSFEDPALGKNIDISG